MINKNSLLSVIFILIAISGCASGPSNKKVTEADLFDSFHALVVEEKVTDARYQFVDGYDYFLVNLPLRYQFRHFQNISGLQAKKDFVINILKESKKVGEEATALYFTRLSPDQLKQLMMAHQDISSDTENLYETYQQHALQAEAKEVNRVRNISTVAEIDQYWNSFVSHIEESIITKGRLRRRLESFLGVPFIEAWIAYHEATDYRGATKPDFENFEFYVPSLDGKRPDDISPDNWALLQQFAPLIFHEIDPGASYAVENDRLGSVYLSGKDYSDIVPHVDTTRPAVYVYVNQKNIQGVDVTQLIYNFFHPARPPLSKMDLEAGLFDGSKIRITLDHDNQPLNFETVATCGCYYRNFPTDRLESLAEKAFPEKLKGKQFYIENSVDGKYDAMFPELVTDIDTKQVNNIVVYFSAGDHQLVTIRSKKHAELLDQVSKQISYQLRDYSELEMLPFNDRYASLFDTDGLVRGADRPEGPLLKPSGVYQAGHPRQRETQMIYFDDAHIDDPELLETYLRLPPNAFGLSE